MRSLFLSVVAAAFPTNYPVMHSQVPKVQMSTKCIEIEEKFVVHNLEELFSKLESLGFTRENEGIKFMDSYYDVPELWLLCQSDCWLRFRSLGWEMDKNDASKLKGSWQLKRARRKHTGSSSATVYEEFENDEAFHVIENMFPMIHTTSFKKDNGNTMMEQYHGEKEMKPFAIIRSFRSSWKHSESWKDVVVDIDGTDFGHTVGEVEIVLNQDVGEQDVKEAQMKIDQLIRLLTDEQRNDRNRPLGKLEAFIMTHRPDVYEACVRSGIMNAKTSVEDNEAK